MSLSPHPPTSSRPPALSRANVLSRFRPWMIVTALCLIYSLAVVAHQGSPLALVTIGEKFKGDLPLPSYSFEGYDGQFTYYIARDPSTASQYLDVPAYRFQRILLPALAMVVSIGQESWIPWALLLINLIALAAGTWLLEILLARHHASRWYALGYGLSLGALGAARLSLPEPLAYGLVLGAIVVGEKRILWSAVLFALAGLTKETALVIAAGYGLYLLTQRRWRDAILFAAITLAPFIGWQLILYQHLGAFGATSGGALATGFEIIPFGGFLRLLTDGSLLIFLVFSAILLPFAILPTLWGLLRSWIDWRTRQISLYTCLLFAAAAMMLFVPFSTYREILGILRFIVGLQIAVILYAAARHDRRVLLYSTLWALTVLFALVSDFGARSN